MDFTTSKSINSNVWLRSRKITIELVIGLIATTMLTACNGAISVPAETKTPLPVAGTTQIKTMFEFVGIMPNTGSEFKPTALSPIQAAINALNYGVVYADGNVNMTANQTCIAVIPEKIGDASGAAESLVSKDLNNGVATYSGGMQVLAEVPLPPNTDTDTYTCAMTYDKSNSVLYQTLVHTDVVTGDVEVLASIPAAYSKGDKVEIINNTIKVNGENVNWTYLPGKEAPVQEQNWSLEIPATPEECTNNLRYVASGNMETDVTALNNYVDKNITKWFPDGVIPSFGYSKNIVRGRDSFSVTILSLTYDRLDGGTVPLTSCSTYINQDTGEKNIVFGTFFQIPNGPSIPIQVLSDVSLARLALEKAGFTYNDSVHNLTKTALDSYNSGLKEGGYTLSLQLYYDSSLNGDYTKTMTYELMQYLDKEYNYSNRINALTTHYGENPTRDQETMTMLQKIINPGYVGFSKKQ